MLEANKRLSFDAEVWQLPHNRPNCVIYIIGTRIKNGVLGGDKHNYYDNLGRWQAPSPDPTPSADLPPSPIGRD